MVYAQPSVPFGKMRRINFWDFEIQTDHQSWPDNQTCNDQQTMRTWPIMDFAVPADHRVKLKEIEKKGKYLNLAWELKKNKLWNVKVTVMPIVIRALGTIYPTPPLGQDMTQGQFLSGVQQVWIQSFPSPRLVASPRLKNPVCPTIYA